MKTVTISKARQNLGAWMARAINGEDIGIIHPTGKIVALRPVEVYSDDNYAITEYGFSPAEMQDFDKNRLKKLRNEKTTKWDGTLRGLRD
jgi:antitoxin (DNA-binding transcriptional repressor) of toxin-antitoxin stability system